MPANKKPRKKYKPKHVLQDPVGFVQEGIRLVKYHESYLLDLKIKNHAAMAALTKGVATKEDMTTLIAMNNMVEALFRLGVAKEYEQEMTAGCVALKAVLIRGHTSGRFILTAAEMNAMNIHMELHDAMMEVVTVNNIHEALDLIRKEHRNGKMHNIIEMAQETADA